MKSLEELLLGKKRRKIKKWFKKNGYKREKTFNDYKKTFVKIDENGKKHYVVLANSRTQDVFGVINTDRIGENRYKGKENTVSLTFFLFDGIFKGFKEIKTKINSITGYIMNENGPKVTKDVDLNALDLRIYVVKNPLLINKRLEDSVTLIEVYLAVCEEI